MPRGLRVWTANWLSAKGAYRGFYIRFRVKSTTFATHPGVGSGQFPVSAFRAPTNREQSDAKRVCQYWFAQPVSGCRCATQHSY